MTLYLLALFIGIVAGLRAMTAPAAVSWALCGAPIGAGGGMLVGGGILGTAGAAIGTLGGAAVRARLAAILGRSYNGSTRLRTTSARRAARARPFASRPSAPPARRCRRIACLHCVVQEWQSRQGRELGAPRAQYPSLCRQLRGCSVARCSKNSRMRLSCWFASGRACRQTLLRAWDTKKADQSGSWRQSR